MEQTIETWDEKKNGELLGEGLGCEIGGEEKDAELGGETKVSEVGCDGVPWLRWVATILTPALLSPLLLAGDPAANCGFVPSITHISCRWIEDETVCRYVLLLMAVYWSLELLPLPVTALLPIPLFPLLGVASTSQTAAAYMKGTQVRIKI